MNRQARISGAADNRRKYPIQQVEYNGKVATATVIMPYGLYANLSNNDTVGLLTCIGGNEQNKFFIGGCVEKRPVDLEQDEVALYHPYTDTFIKFRNNGDMEIDTTNANGNLIINTVDATVNASNDVNVNAENDVVVDAGNDATVTAANTVDVTAEVSATITTPVITIDATVATFDIGDSTFTGTVNFDDVVTMGAHAQFNSTLECYSTAQFGESLKSLTVNVGLLHTHGGVTSGTASTAAVDP